MRCRCTDIVFDAFSWRIGKMRLLFTDLPWKKWSTLIERIRLIQTLIKGGKNEPQKDPGTDYQQAA
jgi:hypothetical protein